MTKAEDSAPAVVVTETAPSNDGSPRSVTVLDKNGGETIVTHAAGLTNLVYGAGYTIKGNKTVEQAAAFLAGG